MPEPVGDPAGRLPVRFIVGIAVPLAVVALAYVLWSISDRLLYIGPLDRAAFGWLVVIPIWIVAPIAAGFIWRFLPPRRAVIAALLVGSTISGVTAGLIWQSIAHPSCAYGAARTPGDWTLPSLALGLVIGGGVAISGLVAATFVRGGRPWRAIVVGAGAEAVMVFAAIVVGGVILMGPGCQRPPI
jgi:hypothetical protein